MIGRNVFRIFQESLSFMEIPVPPVNSGFYRNPGVFQESQCLQVKQIWDFPQILGFSMNPWVFQESHDLPTPTHGFSRNKFRIFQKSLGFPHIPGSHSPGKAGNEFPISAGELPPVPAVFQREFGDSSGIQGLLILSFQQGKKRDFSWMQNGQSRFRSPGKAGNGFPVSGRRREPEPDAKEEQENSHFFNPGVIKAPEKSPRGRGGFAIPDVFKSRLEFFPG